jgi:hypothetical protein
MCISSDLVVFSMDFTMTRSLGVMGELACFKGLKFKITFKILLEMWGRARIRIDKEFKVASTITALLRLSIFIILLTSYHTYLLFSWRTDNIRSNNPEASASRFLGCRSGWFCGTIPKEISRGLLRYSTLMVNVHDFIPGEKKRNHTLVSDSGPVVCTNTTRWANFIQHTRTPGEAESQTRRILSLIAWMRSQVVVS